MKLIKKMILTMVIFAVLGTSFMTWAVFNSIKPALKESGVSFTDMITGNMTKDEKEKLDKSIKENSHKLGNDVGKKFANGLRSLFPNKDSIKFADMPKVDYPYPSNETIIKENNKNAQKAAHDGLAALKSMDKATQAAKTNAISALDPK